MTATKKTSTKKKKRKPPSLPIKSPQYDLFSEFVTNDRETVSNTIEVWDSIPKYFFTPKQVEKLRTPTGHADPFEWSYDYNQSSCTVEIQPALIKQKGGKYKAYFPSVTEELVEEALKKILTDQRYGIHDPNNRETWVRFTLSMIHKELSARGKSRSRAEIKHAIDVMSSCIITLYKEDKEAWKGSILQDLITVDRGEYLEDRNAQHAARLPLFISHAINSLEYRQYNYDRLMGCDGQLTRWLYKQLIHRFRQASLMNNYHFMYSGLERDSGLLCQKKASHNRHKVIMSLDELVSRNVLMNYDVDMRKQGRKIIDVKYTLQTSPSFNSEQKAANKRSSDDHNIPSSSRGAHIRSTTKR
ncbi:MAG: hypothetical protein GY941_20340 [Planctomycetes bacterium]|nr:hypothetical protein [Planctomycetota bacterium]